MSTAHAFPHEPGISASTGVLVSGYIDADVPTRAFPDEFVRRPELVERLRGIRGAELALIVAPPGYGKSALLAEWREADERGFLWLVAGDGRLAADGELLALGLEQLDPLSDGCVVVLDNAHLLSPEALHGTLTSIWRRLPADSAVAVASRTEPELALGRMRAHRALVEIRARDLALTPAQAGTLLRLAGVEAELDVVQTLVRRTNGWPAALYLAALSLQEQADMPDGIAGFRGDDHLLSEYLRDEVVRGLPRSLAVFLRRASVLEQLSADICAEVVEDRRAGVKLEKLHRFTELLEPLDPAHAAFRWHPLLREAMAAELARYEPERVASLHARASLWFERQGDIDAAIGHAVASVDAHRTGELLWARLADYLAQGRTELVARWLDALGEKRVAEQPSLALCAAVCALMIGDAAAAQRWARDAAAGSGAQARPPAALVIEAMACSAGITEMLRAAEQARAAQPQNSPWQAVAIWLEGVARHLAGRDRAGAAALLEEAAERAEHAFGLVSALALAQRAMLAMEDKDWELAVDLTDRSTELIGSLDAPLAALSLAAAAAVRAHQGRADEAKRDLQRGLLALELLDDSLSWYGAEVRILLAHASLYLADVVGARALLARASRQARRAGDASFFRSWFDDAWAYLDTVAETSLAGPSALTIAELRVLRFLPSCRPFREIADQLGVSANTVKTQAHAVYRKLGAASRSEAVLRAREAGLLGQ